MTTLLHPPEQFGVVEEGVYRSCALTPINFPFVQTLCLRTVVNLSPELPVRSVKQFLHESEIEFIHVGLRTWKPDVSWRPLSEELFKDALEIIINTKYHPALIMCTSGVHQTGTVVGCLRRLQNWNLSAILDEYRLYAQSKTRYANEQFIEMFDVDLVSLPSTAAPWLVETMALMTTEEEEWSAVDALPLDEYEQLPEYVQCMFDRSRPLVSAKSTFTEASIIEDDFDD